MKANRDKRIITSTFALSSLLTKFQRKQKKIVLFYVIFLIFLQTNGVKSDMLPQVTCVALTLLELDRGSEAEKYLNMAAQLGSTDAMLFKWFLDYETILRQKVGILVLASFKLLYPLPTPVPLSLLR